MSFRRILLLLAACLVIGPVRPQIIRTETQLVVVDVVVTDKKGNYVKGLTAKDFHVMEDNKEQAIKNFSAESDSGSGQKRSVVLFFDSSTMNLRETALAQQAAIKFVDAGLVEAKGDGGRMIAVANFSGSVKIVQNFTDNADRVKRAVNGVMGSSQFDSSNTSLSNTAADFGARDLFAGLRTLARNLSGLPGRKIIVFFAGGYPATSQRASELTEAIEAANISNVAIFPIEVRAAATGATPSSLRDISDSTPAPSRFGGGRSSTQMRGTPSDTAANNAPVDTAAATRQILDTLADKTGGMTLHGTNDVFASLAKVGQEQNAYYQLSYTPPESAEGSCHKLHVKVDRDGATVRSRSDYCKAKPQQVLAGKPVERDLESRAASSQSGNIDASMQLPFFYTSPNVARVNVAMEITPNALKFEKQKDKFHAALDILGLAYLADGSVGARFSDTLKLDFADQKQIDDLKQKPLHYENKFDIASGQYDLKVVFTSGGESFGKLEMPLVVEPYDKAQLNLSGLALSKEFRAASDVSLDLDALVDDRTPLVANGLRIIPYGGSRFKKTDLVTLYAEMYETSDVSAGLRIRILDRKTGDSKGDSGLMKVDGPKSAGSGVVPLAMKIPIADLAAGAYVLEVQAVEPSGKAVKRTSDFEIE
jgi:VWFA-related protein